MINVSLYLILGLVWSYSIDKYTSQVLKVDPMQVTEIIIQVLLWPLSLAIFSYSFLKELFRQNN